MTTIDLHSELRFSVVRHGGWIDRIALPAVLMCVAYFVWTHPNSWAHAFGIRDIWSLAPAALGLLAVAVSWLQGRTAELRVTSSELVATGNIGKLFSSEVRVQTSEIKSIGYRAGGHGRQGGLYLKRGWRNISLLPGLNPKQAGAVARTILRRFHEIGPEDRMYIV